MLELLGMFVFALTPIIWLVLALCVMHIDAWKAAAGALAVAAVAATIGWQMTPINVATAALEGVAMALWPITIVIIAAVFTYNLTVYSGAMKVIKHMLCSVSTHKRVLTLLIGWCFGGFLEGMAGFGTAVAIPASILVALDIDPVRAILACLVANSVPTMFGSIGIPTTTLASITGIEATELAFVQALQAAPFVLACPFLMVMIVGGGPKALKGEVPVCLVAGLSFSIPEILAARFIGPSLAVVVASVCSLAATFGLCLLTREKDVPADLRMDDAEHYQKFIEIDPKDALVAWCPYLLVFVVLLLTSQLFPAIHDPLSALASTVNIYQGDPTATLTFTWVNTPGVLILICGIVGGIVQRMYWWQMGAIFVNTLKQMSKTILTMLGVLACAKIMGYSGMIASIAAFFVGTLGSLYPIVAPLLGALGTFVTGSGTSSEVLFGNVQLQAAQEIGVSETWLVAANSLGTSAGKMISPQNIAIGCAACGLAGKDGEILGKIAPYAFAFAALMAALVFAGACLL